jgi:hypothetical protein
MPFEPSYGLPYEAGSDLPGWSLTGGPDGSQPVLAEAVAAQLRRIDNLVQELTDQFGVFPTSIQAGTASITPATNIVNTFYNASYFRGTAVVNFAEAFTGTPSVMVTANTTVPGIVIEVSVSAPSSTQCTINLARSSSTGTGIFWIASARTQP